MLCLKQFLKRNDGRGVLTISDWGDIQKPKKLIIVSRLLTTQDLWKNMCKWGTHKFNFFSEYSKDYIRNKLTIKFDQI